MEEIIIEPNKSAKHLLKELWEYRELFYFLSWRNVLVLYKQTFFGIAWSILRPLLTMLIFTFIFTKLAKLSSGSIPYPLLVYAAMLPWQFFSNTVSEGGNSLILNSNMISKIYFPRIIIPTTAIVVSTIDFLISISLLILMMFWYQFFPNWKILYLPLFLLLAVLTSLGMVYWISALNVKYRDFRYIVPFVLQFGLYISPVGFHSDIVPAEWRLIYSLNPMVSVIDGFRWALLGKESVLFIPGFITSAIVGVSIFISGLRFFIKTETKFADII